MTPLEPVPIWVNGQDLKKRSEARSNVSKTNGQARITEMLELKAGVLYWNWDGDCRRKKSFFSRKEKKNQTREGLA
jgi:hypothetical protein